jgi:hypothetical protein
VKLKSHLEEARNIEETYKCHMEEKQCLESEIVALRKEVMEEKQCLEAKRKEEEKRDNILTFHLKERIEELNQLEEEFGQEERRLKNEIISLKIQLEEAKRMKEVMKIHMMKKEKKVEKLKEEVVTLIFKFVKLSKNVEVREISTLSVNKVEEEHSRLAERKN